MKRELKNDFIMGSDHLTEDRSAALMFLDRYSKANPPPMVSEGTSFAQKGAPGKKTGGVKRKWQKRRIVRGERNQRTPIKTWNVLTGWILITGAGGKTRCPVEPKL